MKTSHVKLALVLAVSLGASQALAQDDEPSGGSGMRRPGFLLDRSDHHPRPMMLDVHAVIPYGYLFTGYFPIGVGATFYIPLAHNGFIPPVNDEFGLDFGADIIFFPGYTNFLAFWVPVTAVWKFHITDTFEVFAKLGLALRVWPGYAFPVFPDGIGAVGLNWMFSKSVGLRAELGYPGIKVGVNFAF